MLIVYKNRIVLTITLVLVCIGDHSLFANQFRAKIEVSPQFKNFNNEQFYKNLTDYANSPLVECSYLPEIFYDCPDINEYDSTNCTKWGMTKYSEVQHSFMTCVIFENIECKGSRSVKMKVPCIKYTNKYFVSTLLYSIFLGMFAVDRCVIGFTGIGIGKLITVGGIGIWYIIDIILLVLGIINPNDGSNWIPYY